MDCLRRVFDDPIVLADDSSSGGSLARADAVALSRAGASLGWDVGSHGSRHIPLAGSPVLSELVELDSRGRSFLYRRDPLSTIWKGVWHEAVVGASRDWRGARRAATGDDRNSSPSAASGLSRTPVRDAGVESGYWTGGMLGADRVCRDHGRGDDPHRGSGVGAKVRRGLSEIPGAGCGGVAEAASMIVNSRYRSGLSS
jgi:hypothetical protein